MNSATFTDEVCAALSAKGYAVTADYPKSEASGLVLCGLWFGGKAYAFAMKENAFTPSEFANGVVSRQLAMAKNAPQAA